MANNSTVNKVVYGNQTLIDLSSDTITPNVLLYGYTAHNKAGQSISGNLIYTEDTVVGHNLISGGLSYANS